MQTNSRRNSGLVACFHISAVDTFEITRSDCGYFSDSAIVR